MRRLSYVLLLTLLGIACTDASTTAEHPVSGCRPPHAPPPFRLVDRFPGVTLDRVVTVTRVGGAYFAAEQDGRIVKLTRDGDHWREDTFVHLGPHLSPPEGEAGLIGFAPSPDFEDTGEIFVVYTAPSDTALFRTVVARLRSEDGGRTADLASEETILSIEREIPGHNGGRLVFGPDRYLYIGIGDGSWGDPERRAQDPGSLFGKILRIDVLGGRPYRIPDENPFANGGGRPEVFALGFRNPWSFSFDETGRLWLGDVGHDNWEEIDIVTNGGNYGWPLREGRHCFMESPCDVPGAIEPVHEYSHVEGFSVTGGIVYRGSKLPLAGNYVFGDFMTGRIWAMETEEPRTARLLADSGLYITTFLEDDEGELLVVDYAGHVMGLEPGAFASTGPVLLSELGCIEPQTGAMDRALVPYDVNAELWSDGLDKRRWFSLPVGQRIHVDDDGKFELPPGSMLLKEFSSGGRRIETRMFVNDPDFGWQGFTFEWNESQTDAVLLEDSKTVEVDGSPWTIPSRAQCFACHTVATGRVLGFAPAQLNRASRDGGENQLDELSRRNLFDRPVSPRTTHALANPYDETLPVEPRARAYLHANCSFCHGSTGTALGLLDFREDVPIEAMNVLCRNVRFLSMDTPDGDLALVKPGDPERSFIVSRMAATDALRMPPIGTVRVDHAAVDVVSAWIRTLDSCP